MFDTSLVEKYNKPGPRYTSYPTAVLFQPGYPLAKAHQILHEEGQRPDPLSLYVHVPFCHKLCWFCGCSMLVERNRERIFSHVDIILKEMDMIRQKLGTQRKASQVHFGGGTPTYLEPTELKRLVEGLRNIAVFTEDVEQSIEIDPRQMAPAMIDAILEAGFNRASMGIQDFDPEVQQAVNRVQPYEMVSDRLQSLRSAGLKKINFDLIYGLPHQSLSRFKKTLELVMQLDPDRISLFNYAHIPWKKPHMRLIKDETLPKPEHKLEILKYAIEFLHEHGYVFVGMDHFAKPDDPLVIAMNDGTLQRNFQGYSTHGGLTMIGFGMSSISTYDRLYIQNEPNIQHYEEAVLQGQLPIAKGLELNEEDVKRRALISDLMCHFKLDCEKMGHRMGGNFDEYFPGVRPALEDMVKDGLLKGGDGRYEITFMGRMLIRNIAMLFDQYLKPETSKVYSKTI